MLPVDYRYRVLLEAGACVDDCPECQQLSEKHRSDHRRDEQSFLLFACLKLACQVEDVDLLKSLSGFKNSEKLRCHVSLQGTLSVALVF